MTTIEDVLRAIDQLPLDQMDIVIEHARRREQMLSGVWEVPGPVVAEALTTMLQPYYEAAATMSEEELIDIENTLDEALAEVRRERVAQSRV